MVLITARLGGKDGGPVATGPYQGWVGERADG